MIFKHAHLQVEFDGVHPDVAKALRQLDAWSQSNGLPEVVVTHVFRTRAFMEETYWVAAAKKLAILKPELTAAKVETLARAAARMRFSWHLVRCAADIRNSHYTARQCESVLAWLNGHCVSPMFEVVQHDVGKGNHIHVGRRDFDWRTRFAPKD